MSKYSCRRHVHDRTYLDVRQVRRPTLMFTPRYTSGGRHKSPDVVDPSCSPFHRQCYERKKTYRWGKVIPSTGVVDSCCWEKNARPLRFSFRFEKKENQEEIDGYMQRIQKPGDSRRLIQVPITRIQYMYIMCVVRVVLAPFKHAVKPPLTHRTSISSNHAP